MKLTTSIPYVTFKEKDNILLIKFTKNKSISLIMAKEIVMERARLQLDRELPILCDARKIKYVDKAARDYFANEGSLFIKALAILAEPPIANILARHYLETYKPAIPTKIFAKKSEAWAFLKNTLNDKNQ